MISAAVVFAAFTVANCGDVSDALSRMERRMEALAEEVHELKV